MKEWTGEVIKITRTPWQEVILWSFKINQSERMFRMGKKEPDFKEGEWITFQERNSNVKYDSIRLAEEGEATEVAVVVPTGAEGTPETVAVTSASNGSNVGSRMQYQAARADACRIVVAALAADHLPHAANVAKGKRLDLLTGYVKEVTKTMLEQEYDDVEK